VSLQNVPPVTDRLAPVMEAAVAARNARAGMARLALGTAGTSVRQPHLDTATPPAMGEATVVNALLPLQATEIHLRTVVATAGNAPLAMDKLPPATGRPHRLAMVSLRVDMVRAKEEVEEIQTRIGEEGILGMEGEMMMTMITNRVEDGNLLRVS